MGEARKRNYESEFMKDPPRIVNSHDRNLWRAQERLGREASDKETLLKPGARLNREFLRHAHKLHLTAKELIAAKGIIQSKQRRLDVVKRLVIRSLTKALEEADVSTET